MQIPVSIDVELLVQELKPLFLERLRESNQAQQGWVIFLDNIDAFLLFFIDQLTKSEGHFKDEHGWTRILSADLERITPFYLIILSHLITKGIILKFPGSNKAPVTRLSRRNGYRLKPEYEDAETRVVAFTPEIVQKLLLGTQYNHVDDCGNVCFKAHTLPNFEDNAVEQLMVKIWEPPSYPVEVAPYCGEEDIVLTPEEEKQEFISLLDDVIECEGPYQWKWNYIRELATESGIPLSDKEIEDLLAENEKLRKQNWEATLKRFAEKK